MRSVLRAVAVLSGAFVAGWMVGAALHVIPHTVVLTIHTPVAAVIAGCISALSTAALLAFSEV